MSSEKRRGPKSRRPTLSTEATFSLLDALAFETQAPAREQRLALEVAQSLARARRWPKDEASLGQSHEVRPLEAKLRARKELVERETSRASFVLNSTELESTAAQHTHILCFP